MRWGDFESAAPRLAAEARRRITRDQLLLLGTLRRDGSARISAVECDLAGGDLLIGMIHRSMKALDLLRDPRVTAHSLPPGRDNGEGDVKLYGRAVPQTDPLAKGRYEDAIFARIGWRPGEPYHCFALDLDSAALVRFFGDGRQSVLRWRAGTPEDEQERRVY